jgi:hypothetical protein
LTNALATLDSSLVTPRQVELKQDLVSSCVVGDVVTVLGLVKVLATGEQGEGGGAALAREWGRLRLLTRSL